MAYITKASQVRSKTPHKKKAHKKPKSKIKTPLPKAAYHCANCGRSKYLEVHHVFFGDKPTRDNSSKNNCVEYLCWHCHRGNKTGVHGGNRQLDLELKVKHQIRLMNEGMSINEFRNLFGMSYIEEELDGTTSR